MEFPFGHGHHSHATNTHHHHRRDDEEPSVYPPPPGNTFFSQPPPPIYGAVDEPPPRPHAPATQVLHTSHVSHGSVSQDFNNYSAFPPPPPRPHHHHQPDSFNYGYPSEVQSAPAAPAYSLCGTATSVYHVSHDAGHHHHQQHEGHIIHHTHSPDLGSTVQNVSHVGGGAGSVLFNKPTVRVVTKAAPDYSLTIRYGKVVLAPSDPRDEYQHWYKDEKYSTRVKDEEGCPAFSLVNKVTGEAIKHSIGDTYPVRLIPYNPDYLDESILWTESRDLGDSYRAIRMVNNVHLNVDAYHGDKNSGGVHGGTEIVLWKWNKGDNQRWKIIPQ